MKLSVLKPFALLCAGMLLLSACRKNDDDELLTYYTTIQGQWTLSVVGLDINNNNVLEANEIIPVADSNIRGNIVFNPDRSGSAFANYQSFPLPSADFTWNFENSGKTLTTTFGSNKISSTVTTLDENNLVLLNKSIGISSGIWLGFVK